MEGGIAILIQDHFPMHVALAEMHDGIMKFMRVGLIQPIDHEIEVATQIWNPEKLKVSPFAGKVMKL